MSVGERKYILCAQVVVGCGESNQDQIPMMYRSKLPRIIIPGCCLNLNVSSYRARRFFRPFEKLSGDCHLTTALGLFTMCQRFWGDSCLIQKKKWMPQLNMPKARGGGLSRAAHTHGGRCTAHTMTVIAGAVSFAEPVYGVRRRIRAITQNRFAEL